MNRALALAALLTLGTAAPSWAAVECSSGPLTAEEPQAGAQLGCSAFVRGSALFLGGHRDDSEGPDTGAVTPFQRSAGPWTRETDLTASDARADTGEGAQFGFSVSADGDWLAVGAPFADSAQGVDTGAVYLFQRGEGRWVERQKLTPPGAGRGERFGQVVSMSGDTLLAGAPDDDEAGSLSGSVSVFERSGETWSLRQKLTGSDTAPFDNFGFSVSLDGGTAAVGAPFHDSRSAGGNSGAAYVFERSAQGWRQSARLTADDGAAEDQLGSAVSILGNALAVGARGDGAGSVSIFERRNGDWTRTGQLSGEAAGDQLGVSVAMMEGRLLIGARFNSAGGPGAGAAYLAVRGTGGWALAEKLPLPAAAGDRFGHAVSADGDDLLVGGYLDDVGSLADAGSGSACRLVPDPPRLVIETNAEGPAEVGNDLVYTVKVTNQGTGTATGVVLKDHPSATGVLRPVEADHAGCTPDAKGFSCDLGNLSADASTTVRFTFRVLDVCKNEVVNKAVVSAANGTGAEATAPTPVVRTAPPLVLENKGPIFAIPGETVHYTLRVTNPGPNRACGVLVEAPVPDGLTSPVIASGDCTVEPSGVRCPVGNLPAGQSRLFEVSFVVPAGSCGAHVVNTARVTSRGDAPRTSTQETRVHCGSVVTALCEGITGSFVEGGTVTSTYLLRNDGRTPQTDNPGPELTLLLPAGLSPAGGRASAGTVAAGTPVTWNGAIPAGGTVTIAVDAVLGPGTVGSTLCNQATVFFDADANGTNEASAQSGDFCCLGVLTPEEIPALGDLGLALLALLVTVTGLRIVRKRGGGFFLYK